MTTAKEVAAELRKLADAIDREPDQELPTPEIEFRCKYLGDRGKPMFLALARLFPRPVVKGVQEYASDGLQLSYTSSSLRAVTMIERSRVCKLIEPERVIPAKYDCESLLSPEEEAGLDAPAVPVEDEWI